MIPGSYFLADVGAWLAMLEYECALSPFSKTSMNIFWDRQDARATNRFLIVCC
jgi:hypothetical protein